MLRVALVTIGLAAAGASTLSCAADARAYPMRPVRLVTPSAPGSTADSLARIVTQIGAAPLLLVAHPALAAASVRELLASGVLILMPLAKAGKVKVLAVTGPQRSRAVPDVPTVVKTGALKEPRARATSKPRTDGVLAAIFNACSDRARFERLAFARFMDLFAKP